MFEGCLPSIIKVPVLKDDKTIEMFGQSPNRDFYLPETIGDSLKEKWQAKVNGGLTNSSVTVYSSYVFVNDLSGWITCLDLKSGNELGRLKNKGAVYSSPVVDNHLLIFAVALNDAEHSQLYIYDYLNGDTKLKIDIEGKVLSEILKAGDKIIFNSEEGGVYCYSLNGDKLWETATSVPIHCSPAMGNGIIFFGNDKGEAVAINSKDGKIIYKKKIGHLFLGCAAISDSLAFLGSYDGSIYAVNLSDGKLKWKFDTGTRIISTPVYNDKYIYVCNLSGQIFSLRKDDGKETWRTDAGGVINATPLLTNNFLLVPDLKGELLFLNAATGKIEKRLGFPNHVKLSPLIFENTLFTGYDDGRVEAYEIIK